MNDTGHSDPSSPPDKDRGGRTDDANEALLLERLRREVRTSRLVVVDDHEEERLVAELVDDVMELRLTLPGSPAGYRTSLLVFATPARADWCAGLGIQLWVDGTVARELTWWADEGELDRS